MIIKTQTVIKIFPWQNIILGNNKISSLEMINIPEWKARLHPANCGIHQSIYQTARSDMQIPLYAHTIIKWPYAQLMDRSGIQHYMDMIAFCLHFLQIGLQHVELL